LSRIKLIGREIRQFEITEENRFHKLYNGTGTEKKKALSGLNMPSSRVPSEVQTDASSQKRSERGSRHLHASGELWARYNRYLFSKVQPFLKGRICEVGSGTGQITQFLTAYESVTALDPESSVHLQALQKFAYQLNINCVQTAIEACPNYLVPEGQYDTVVCVNLLEHLKYDITVLEIMGELLTDTGHVIAVVPAYNSLYGPLDRAQGHLRRFNRLTLREAFLDAGLEVTTCFYFDILGMLGWYWHSRWCGYERIPTWSARLYNRLLPLVGAFENHFLLPFGQSLLMVGRKPAG